MSIEPFRGSTSTRVELAPVLDLLQSLADDHARNARSERTRVLYATDQAEFAAWCTMAGVTAMPATPETVALYVTHLAAQVRADGHHRFKASSLTRKIAAIASAHRDAGFDSPTANDRVRQVMAGIRCAGDATVRRKWPLMTEDVVRIITTMEHDRWPAGVKAARDTFAILLGYAAALRRGSTARVIAGELDLNHDGLAIRLPSSKTDQDGRGRTVAIPYGKHPVTCVPCAWVRWSRILHAADTGADPMGLVLKAGDPDHWVHVCRTAGPGRVDQDAPVFPAISAAGVIGDRSVYAGTLYRALRVRAEAAGLDPDRYGFHSLRAGFVTQARRNGASAREVRLQTGHTSDAMVDVYDREFNPLAGGNAVTRIGL